ncbi:MAG TPA: Arm DNA-binding domain-containing protein, partial [Stellaceae bacterium]|nr:Arm DNA-binding domain-containing protein [Stellaceae bacterium]
MPTITFIARGIAGLAIPATGRIEYFDRSTSGFGLRVTSRGHRSWICFYRHKGEKRRYTIGPFPQLGLAEARERAKDILRSAAGGGDPANKKKQERKAETLREVA